jgi:alkylated DNA repair dioxygenase AlkB
MTPLFDFQVVQLLTIDEANKLFNDIENRKDWSWHQGKLFGYPKPRKQISFSENLDLIYTDYDKNKNIHYKTDDFLNNLISKVNDKLNTHYNSLLILKYEGNKHHLDWHSDNYEQWCNENGCNCGVTSLALGEDRLFAIRDKNNFNNKLQFIHPKGHLIKISTLGNKLLQHKIPKSKNFDGTRIAITFRHLVNKSNV